eukprot:SAG25_NODE_304_length_10125_cov_10.664273_8_plen_480_part_00
MTAACANLLSATGSSTGTVYLHRHRQELLGSFKNPRLYEEAHVSLFPCARGGPGTESDSSASQWDTVRRAARFTPSSFDCDVEHQLKHYTSAFELHKTYIFVVWNISTRHKILQRANLTAGRRPDLDIEQLASEMAQFVTSGARRPSSGSSVQALYRDCDAVGRDVKGSPYERKAFRTPLFGFDVEFGVKNLFVTLSPADCYDLRVAIANEEPMFRTIEWRQQSTWPAAVRIYEAMASRPATAARYHARLFHAYLRAFVGWLYTQGRSGRRVASAVFGKVKAFGGMVETQSRGSEHIHLSLHVAASCVQYLRERLGHAERRKQLFEYLLWTGGGRAGLPSRAVVRRYSRTAGTGHIGRRSVAHGTRASRDGRLCQFGDCAVGSRSRRRSRWNGARSVLRGGVARAVDRRRVVRYADVPVFAPLVGPSVRWRFTAAAHSPAAHSPAASFLATAATAGAAACSSPASSQAAASGSATTAAS